jgi:hypothetical protein
MVEQRHCKPEVCGSIPSSDFSNITLRKHGISRDREEIGYNIPLYLFVFCMFNEHTKGIQNRTRIVYMTKWTLNERK